VSVLFVAMPFTNLKLRFEDQNLVEVDFDVEMPADSEPDDALMCLAREQLKTYAVTASHSLDLPLAPGGTEYQQRVWTLLRQIPAGSVRTYGDIAAELHSSPRAVGNACRANPIPLFIPCHRVVAKAGMGGFAGKTAGPVLSLKETLLRHEGVEIPIINPK